MNQNGWHSLNKPKPASLRIIQALGPSDSDSGESGGAPGQGKKRKRLGITEAPTQTNKKQKTTRGKGRKFTTDNATQLGESGDGVGDVASHLVVLRLSESALALVGGESQPPPKGPEETPGADDSPDSMMLDVPASVEDALEAPPASSQLPTRHHMKLRFRCQLHEE